MTAKKKTAPVKKAHHPSAEKSAQNAAHTHPVKAGAAGQPVFNQPVPSPDPGSFSKPVTDKKLKGIVKLEPFPTNGPDPGVLVEPVLTLAQVYGSAGPAKEAAITKAGQIVFHCVGDTGSVSGPQTQNLVADKMVTDFNEDNPVDVPSFFFHLGDVVMLLWRSHLLLRPVLRTLPGLSCPHYCCPGQPRRRCLSQRQRPEPRRLCRQLLHPISHPQPGCRRSKPHHHDPARGLLHF